ncbi:hypothetical protein ACLGC3_02100 [Helicobacter pylori]
MFEFSLKEHSFVKSICLLFENYGAFKSYEIIVCCLIPPLTLQRRERFGTSFMGAVVGLEARE